MNFLDALGDPIVLGNIYGYSTTYEGHRTTVIGRAEKITEAGNVTLRIVRRLRMQSGVMIDTNGETAWGEKAKPTVSYGSQFLFPVHSKD